ncbi:hypothetical protein N9597_00135 [Candidatus Marinimicrobia bacterium]|nr:hypothetical protein [Candidatus Neomarinimicrobiota bacterium]
MNKILLILSLSFMLAGEMEVDGNLKVTGQIDASNQRVKNVGPPTDMMDAINAQALQDALRDDTQYEYKMILIKITESGNSTAMWGHEYGQDASDNWNYHYHNNLISFLESNWIIDREISFGTINGYCRFLFTLKRPIEE